MPFPTPIVEIAFSDSPYVASPTWTNVTAYVRSMSTDRGRSDDWSEFTGSASVVLDNRDRRFDPFNTTGPYYGLLLPRRQIRIRAQTVEGGVTTTHDVFRGFISGWAPQWTDGGKDSTVTLSCFDAMQLVASDQLRADWAFDWIRSTSARHYWPCDEPVVPFVGGSLTDYGSYPQTITLNSNASNGQQLAAGLVNRSVKSTGYSGGTTGFGILSAPTSFTVSMWAIFDELAGVAGNIGWANWGAGYNQATGKYVITVADASVNVIYTYTTNDTYDGGVSRLVSFAFNNSTKALTLYLDAVAVPITTTSAGAFLVQIGEVTTIDLAQVQQIIVWDYIQPDYVIQILYSRSMALFDQDTAGRFGMLMGESLFSRYEIPAFPLPYVSNAVLDITDDSPPLSTELQKVADSEGAPLFCTKNGTLTLFSQSQIRSVSRSLNSQVTYGDGGTPIGLDVQLTPDGDSMRNVVSIRMSQGGVYLKENTASVTAYGAASVSIDTQVKSVADAERLANIISGWGGQVYPRLSPIDVVLSRDNLWAPTLALELMDRITVNVKPPTGNTVSVPMLVQRISHSVVAGQWQTTLEGSARWAAVWKWGQSTWGGTDLLG